MSIHYNDLQFTCVAQASLMEDLLKLWRYEKITSLAAKTFGELKRVGFNSDSGYVWLEDDDFNCLLPNNGELDLWITMPYSGIDGFLADFLKENDLVDELHPEEKDYLLNLKAMSE